MLKLFYITYKQKEEFMFYLIKVIKKYIVNMNPVTRRSDSLILGVSITM